MKTYTVAATEALLKTAGVEIMASGWEEARDKAEVMGVPGHPTGIPGETTYAIECGGEIRVMECDEPYTVLESLGVEIEETEPELL